MKATKMFEMQCDNEILFKKKKLSTFNTIKIITTRKDCIDNISSGLKKKLLFNSNYCKYTSDSNFSIFINSLKYDIMNNDVLLPEERKGLIRKKESVID